MAEKRVAVVRPKVWRVAVKSTGPLPLETLKLLPSQLRSPLRAYLASPDNKGVKGWEELSVDDRKPFVQQFQASRKHRTLAKTLLQQKAALQVYISELESRIGEVLGEKPAPEVAAAQDPEPEKPKRVRRRGWGQQALQRFKKSLLAKLSDTEREALTQSEVVNAWKALPSRERRTYYTAPKPVSEQS